MTIQRNAFEVDSISMLLFLDWKAKCNGLEAMERDRGYIFNLGHGISPDVSEEAVNFSLLSKKGDD
jgi:uroporphyrinogen-III decarboxylase